MRYQIDEEDWIPEYQTKQMYSVNSTQLTLAVFEGKLRTRTLTNPNNDKQFQVYSVSDLEELFSAKKPSKAQVARWFECGDEEGF